MYLSVIIALYNTEKYISQCIESIYNSNMHIDEFEVIVINDGSTDSSADIVRRLQNSYSNLILLEQENRGQSAARNRGFEVARGRYIFCLDSDDSVNSIELSIALKCCIDNNLDLLPVNLRKFDENFQPLPLLKDNYDILDKPVTGGEFLLKFMIYGSMCRYFYKREIINKYGVILTEGIFHEDEEFVTKFIGYCQRILYFRHDVYKQVVRSNSTMRKSNRAHRVRLINDLITVVNNLKTHSHKYHKDTLVYQGIVRRYEILLVSLFLKIKKDNLQYSDVKSTIKILCSKGLYPMHLHHAPLRFRIMSVLLNCSIFNRIYFS